jgi:hypothetical protein
MEGAVPEGTSEAHAALARIQSAPTALKIACFTALTRRMLATPSPLSHVPAKALLDALKFFDARKTPAEEFRNMRDTTLELYQLLSVIPTRGRCGEVVTTETLRAFFVNEAQKLDAAFVTTTEVGE